MEFNVFFLQICDVDNDGILSDTELNEFQVNNRNDRSDVTFDVK